jgi:hypothetical protein
MLAGTHCSAVLGSLEAICSGLSRCDWAFGKTVHAIHLIGSKLSHAMPVNPSSVGSQVTCHWDLEGVSPVGNKCLKKSAFWFRWLRAIATYRAWNLTINDHDLFGKTIWRHSLVGDVEMVLCLSEADLMVIIK